MGSSVTVPVVTTVVDAVERQFEIALDQFFQGAGKLALLGLDELQIGEPLARLRFLMLEGLDRERNLEVGNVADEVEAGRIAAAGASADEYAPLTGEIGHIVYSFDRKLFSPGPSGHGPGCGT
jgi:hypothetical protein